MSLFPRFFFNDVIRKHELAFKTLFDNISVARYDSAGVIQQMERVVLEHSPKQKFFVRTEQDPNLMREPAIKLPRMGFEITGYQYDAKRKQQTTQYLTAIGPNGDPSRKQYTPVPWNFDFNLYVVARHQTEGNQIIEQILPFFSPSWFVTLNAIPEMCLQVNIPVTLNSINCDDNYDGSFLERRVILWTLSFTMAGFFYMPVSDDGKLIYDSTVTVQNEGDGTGFVAQAIGTPPNTIVTTVTDLGG